MRLKKFSVKNYNSVIDSGEVELSDHDKVTVFAGQNESGKSSVLKALRDFERSKFDKDSIPFTTGKKPIQSISCTYDLDSDDDLVEALSDILIDEHKLSVEDGQKILDAAKISKIKQFTIERKNEAEKVSTKVDENTLAIFLASILDKPQEVSEDTEPNTDNEEQEVKKDKYVELTQENNSDVADLFWKIGPKIVFFDDFCDLLPDKMLVSDLKNKKTDTKGCCAVRNLEKILETDFVAKDDEEDSVRRTKEDEENDSLSIDFQNDWGQRIHGENQVVVKYEFQKRDDEDQDGSYINFYVETKKGQRLPPKQRSKRLVWFLSLWLELKTQDIEHEDLVLLLDEPDQHLHVKAQTDILKLINKLSTDTEEYRGDQIFYATHSPYLIEIDRRNRIKLVLNTEQDGTRIEDVVSSKIDTEYKKDALQPIADAIGLNVSEFSPLNDKNVLLEGISDFYYFSAMRKLLGKSTNYNFVPGVGVRKINGLISLCIGYGLEWISVIDDDPEEGGSDSKTKFEEIRDYAFDGDEERTKDRVHILNGIVGIENMFTYDDLKLINSNIIKAEDNDKVKAVGRKRKVIFSTMFFEKVEKQEIKLEDMSKTAVGNFERAFKFIEARFPNDE